MTTALVYDSGLFVELAERLASEFDEVLYFMPWKHAFPKVTDTLVGDGLDGVERILDFWENVDRADVIIFPDVYNADLQKYLREEGHAVWGMGDAEWLELDRWRSREWQKSVKLSTPSYVKIEGLTALRKHLDGVEDKWIKISTFRGDMETWHHLKAFSSQPRLNKLAVDLFPVQDQVEFLVEDPIEGVEIGYDGLTVDGAFPQSSHFGYEVKDLGYIGVVKPYSSMSKSLLSVNGELAKVFKKSQSRGFFSTEIRMSKGKDPILLDPCMRCGSPPTEVTMENLINLREVLTEGSKGNLVEPEYESKYVATAVMKSQWAKRNPLAFDFPESVSRFVKIHNKAKIDGRVYFIPQREELEEVGAVIGLGDTLEEALKMVEEVASEVHGYELNIQTGSLEEAQRVIEKGKKLGVEF